ncbi:peptidase M50 [gamma proteobacterium HTCC5015]|nr:peptidase M50 [gamma proteobacterium HTCC5015]
MLSLLTQGEYGIFILVLLAIILSLTLHEFGHAIVARALGDDTAERLGRLTLNPVSHIDPMGLLMVATVGFGYAKPVPFNPNNLRMHWGSALVAAAGPAMNLVLAILAVNVLALAGAQGWMLGETQQTALVLMVHINLLLMLFNLLPLGPLDGHYIASKMLPPQMGRRYDAFNAQYGLWLFMGLIVLSILGFPIFDGLLSLSNAMIPWITWLA